MKKLVLSFLLTALTGSALLAQKTIYDPNAEKRTVSGFHGIDVATGIQLTLTEGNTEDVAVSAATAEFRDKIVTKVVNGVLKIYFETKTGAVNKTKETKDMKAYVSYKKLDLLHVTTGAKVKIDGVLKSSSLDMEANTGAIVDGEVNIASLKISQNTGSKVSLSGKADKLDIEGDTGSKFKGEDMSASNCTVKVSTGAIISVKAEKELQVKASTGGSVKYKGDPTVKEIKKSTGGTVNKI
ncbi:MAG: head GIN domain-containing protein [Bacteroidota bacterium]|nr:head GIN domain-containing protein [Bacteroidota bacterium]